MIWKARRWRTVTIRVELSADYECVPVVPAITAHSPPPPIETHLHPHLSLTVTCFSQCHIGLMTLPTYGEMERWGGGENVSLSVHVPIYI